MKRVIRRVAVTLIGVLSLTSTVVAESEKLSPAFVDSLLPEYLELQRALALNELQVARSSAQELVKNMQDRSSLADFLEPLNGIATSPNIAEARSLFATVSTQLVHLVEQTGTSDRNALFQLKCPMAFDGAGAIWVQDTRTVLNPYFGRDTDMLRCGSVEKQIAGEPQLKLPPGGQHAHGLH